MTILIRTTLAALMLCGAILAASPSMAAWNNSWQNGWSNGWSNGRQGDGYALRVIGIELPR